MNPPFFFFWYTTTVIHSLVYNTSVRQTRLVKQITFRKSYIHALVYARLENALILTRVNCMSNGKIKMKMKPKIVSKLRVGVFANQTTDRVCLLACLPASSPTKSRERESTRERTDSQVLVSPNRSPEFCRRQSRVLTEVMSKFKKKNSRIFTCVHMWNGATVLHSPWTFTSFALKSFYTIQKLQCWKCKCVWTCVFFWW